MLCNYSILIILISAITLLLVEQPSKVDGKDDSSELIFRINKLNLIWTKAQHSLGPSKLKDLRNELTKHEFDELTLKKMKAHGQDKDGLFEAATRKKLLSIMKKYSLDKYYDDIHQPVDQEHDRKRENLKRVKEESKEGKIDSHLKVTFRDKRLDKLWKKAEQSSFSQEQLMVLYEEFQHQQEKLDEHYETLNMIEQELERKSKEDHDSENSVESAFEKDNKKKLVKISKSKESQSDKKARLESDVQQALNEKYSYIKRDIEKLHKKIVDRKIDSDDKNLFEEAPVNELWTAAINSNFTAEELESFKEELEHYQNRIKKLKHYEVQFERNNIRSAHEETSPGVELDPETKHLRKRVKELSFKVEKTHKSLEEKIASKREEL